jgi:hypothetical protein
MVRQAGNLQCTGLIEHDLFAGLLFECLDLSDGSLGQLRHQIGAARLGGEAGCLR